MMKRQLATSAALAKLSENEDSALVCPHAKARWSQVYAKTHSADGAGRGYLFRS